MHKIEIKNEMAKLLSYTDDEQYSYLMKIFMEYICDAKPHLIDQMLSACIKARTKFVEDRIGKPYTTPICFVCGALNEKKLQ